MRRRGTARRAVCWWRPVGLAPIRCQIMRAGQIAAGLRRFQARGERPDRIRAGVDQDLRVQPQQTPASVGIGGHPIVVLTCVGAGNQMLASVLDPAEWRLARRASPGRPRFLPAATGICIRSRRRCRAARRRSPPAERSASRPARRGSDAAPGSSMHDKLRRAMIPPAQQPAPFHRVHHGAQLNVRSTFTGAEDAATASMPLSKAVSRNRLSPQWSCRRAAQARAARGAAGDRRQLRVVHLDELGRILGAAHAGGDTHGDRLTPRNERARQRADETPTACSPASPTP